jgi:hypothetical protein
MTLVKLYTSNKGSADMTGSDKNGASSFMMKSFYSYLRRPLSVLAKTARFANLGLLEWVALVSFFSGIVSPFFT